MPSCFSYINNLGLSSFVFQSFGFIETLFSRELFSFIGTDYLYLVAKIVLSFHLVVFPYQEKLSFYGNDMISRGFGHFTILHRSPSPCLSAFSGSDFRASFVQVLAKHWKTNQNNKGTYFVRKLCKCLISTVFCCFFFLFVTCLFRFKTYQSIPAGNRTQISSLGNCCSIH